MNITIIVELSIWFIILVILLSLIRNKTDGPLWVAFWVPSSIMVLVTLFNPVSYTTKEVYVHRRFVTFGNYIHELYIDPITAKIQMREVGNLKNIDIEDLNNEKFYIRTQKSLVGITGDELTGPY